MNKGKCAMELALNLQEVSKEVMDLTIKQTAGYSELLGTDISEFELMKKTVDLADTYMKLEVAKVEYLVSLDTKLDGIMDKLNRMDNPTAM